MNELRRILLDEGDAPLELSPELRFLGARQAALAELLLDHFELYQHLMQRYREEGSSPDVQAIALRAAGDMATVLQSMRSRQDLVNALVQHPDHASVPLWLIDQLFYSFALLTEPCDASEEQALLVPDELFFSSRNIKAWLQGLGLDPPYVRTSAP